MLRERMEMGYRGTMRAVTIFLALGLGLPGTAGCARVSSASYEAAPVRVLVYNVHAGKDMAGADNLARVADLVRESRADLVLLQEVDRGTRRSGWIDQLAELASRTGYHAAFGRTLDFQGGEFGVARLSRWQIREDTLILLPVDPLPEREESYYEPRGVLHARIAAPQGEIHVLNTHLDHAAEDGYRLQEVATVLALANRLRDEDHLVLLGGDFNATPESAVMTTVQNGGWTDAWPGCEAGEGWTFPADVPTRRIDYLILPPVLRCDSAAVLDTQASDHRPVLFVIHPRGSN